MQKIVLELKLLTAAARRAGAQAPVQRQDAQIAAIRSEMQGFEERVGARLQAHEKNMADLQRAATVAVEALRGQLATLDTQLSAAMDRCAQPDPKLEDLEERVTSRFVRGLEAAGERIARVEQNVDAVREHSAGFEKDVTAQLAGLEAALRTQELAQQAARTALAQTDDVLERVVEALDSLQSAVLEHTDQRSTAASAN
jgi:predicted  nucleic acid-binding Zn-ribbon protein